MSDVFDNLETPLWWRGKKGNWPSDEQRRQAREKRKTTRKDKTLSRLYIKLSWYQLATGMNALSTDRSTRLWLLLKWQTRVQGPSYGWVEPTMYMLDALKLSGSHYNLVVNRLEKLGMVEVQRRQSKRPLLRLVEP